MLTNTGNDCIVLKSISFLFNLPKVLTLRPRPIERNRIETGNDRYFGGLKSKFVPSDVACI